ncbi:hypothetical protein [Amycolatopsis sp. H20-H5]|uniref:hypothetical protein n=1 Tax=Amycolatopsis sp. H20-H5 TaxID=3046309 RepID=UPI002DBA0802|nr:hypothetical protein [Amycolatopsis sp. H20-H5]
MRLEDGRSGIEDLLRLAHADMPPTPFDSVTVLAEGRRRLLRRRFAVSLGVALAVSIWAAARWASRPW